MAAASKTNSTGDQSATKPEHVHQLYLVCKSNINIVQGSDPTQPKNTNSDFFVGDVFQAKLSTEHEQFIQLRAASKTKHKQWIPATAVEGADRQISNIFTPSIGDYYHLDIGATATSKCKHLNKLLTDIVHETYGVSLGDNSISGLIITYLPFYYPVLTVNGTLFRGRGYFTQFCVPYFYGKDYCKEYVRRVEQLRSDTIATLNDEVIDEATKRKRDYEYEKWLMEKTKEQLEYEERHDPDLQAQRAQMTEDEKEEAAHNAHDDKLLDAEALNQIVSTQKGSLPQWIQSIYKSVPAANAYFYCIELYFIANEHMVPFKTDEYLEQNKYLDFYIKHEVDERQRFKWKQPVLKARKIGPCLTDLMLMNETGGSLWFEVDFDPQDDDNPGECAVFDDKVQVFRCRIGGKWQGDSKSRHYVIVKDENGDIFDQYLPMIVVNMVI
eukprot:CAMPEP_0197024312 /NCGR_PEP_ID=MMETSP1384-20130603/4881_1 /TAXON_ID=29189 /ORGANISM="Ammonia sp." /LENGTH=439 /DNA_ID=CAMNT_0042452675 /DNA_START=29 /DNA_END=1348 /DNA_ORIENTATION=+